jgi:hypothetical protein
MSFPVELNLDREDDSGEDPRMPHRRSFFRATTGAALATLILIPVVGGMFIGASRMHNATLDGFLSFALVFFIGGAIYVEGAAAVRALRRRMRAKVAARSGPAAGLWLGSARVDAGYRWWWASAALDAYFISSAQNSPKASM